MGSEKRFFIAFALIIGFLILWFDFIGPKPLRKAPMPTADPTQTGTPLSSPSPAAVKREDPAKEIPQMVPTPPPLPVTRKETETDTLRMRFTNRTGSMESIELKNYLVERTDKSNNIEVVPFRGSATPPLQWQLKWDSGTFDDAAAMYKEVASGEKNVTYEKLVGKGLTVRKRFEWKEDSYALDHWLEIHNATGEPIRMNAETALYSGTQKEQKKTWSKMLAGPGDPLKAIAYVNESSVRWTTDDILEGPEIPEGGISWAGFDSHYFLLTALPVEGRWTSIGLTAVGDKENVESVRLALAYPPREIAPGATVTYRVRLFAGPKDIGVLRANGASLDRAIDLGNWLGPIARPILLFLRWLYSLVPNYGIAIILLTILVRLLMFPLAHKQAKSMQKMAEHKPQMDAIRAKHKDDKEAQSREMMSYMRTHKVNPMGGCLLILPQMPVLFALYRVLYNSIELRHAPFMLWVTDLSLKDPIFVLPLLLGVTMYLQQKLTPTPGADPSQQAIMKFMPVMFTAFMIILPAGLNLYIFVSTLWGVVQQYWVKKTITPTTIPERKARRAGM